MKLIRGGYSNEKIWFSDVEVRSRRNAYWGRKWNIRDGIHVSLVMIMHLICLFAPFHYNLNAVWVAALLYVITGLFGITLSYHRNLAHLSFKLPKLLEYLFAYCGAHALQGHPIDWVSRHRFHHKYTDTERDPHSPREGFWFSHINWIFDNDHAYQKVGKRKNVADLRKQAFYRFLQSSYLIHPIALGALLFRFGGLPFLVWGMGVRTVTYYHSTFLVNSACHVWGTRAWNTTDTSKNNWVVAMLVFGEGWHNNHHAFESSARQGLEWWQIDITWCVIKSLEYVGLARDVKLPSEAQMRAKAVSQQF
ncbi:hypothetical protein Syun_022819 [Stephania yunnanensis]|uniref:Fatty acid desaturase domain-containing protein n=1 Tax=Stephania yunnanensis TaxID=152371 RepID=A0AAP0FKC2_9MAGN